MRVMLSSDQIRILMQSKLLTYHFIASLAAVRSGKEVERLSKELHGVHDKVQDRAIILFSLSRFRICSSPSSFHLSIVFLYL